MQGRLILQPLDVARCLSDSCDLRLFCFQGIGPPESSKDKTKDPKEQKQVSGCGMSACGAARACSGRQEAEEDLKSAAELGLWAQFLELKVTTETKTPNLLCSFSEPKHCYEIVIPWCLFCHLANMVHFDLAAAKHMISWHV